jgi:hypothetical protein
MLNFLRLTFPNAEWSFWDNERTIIWTEQHDKVNKDLLELIVDKVVGCHWVIGKDNIVRVILPQE